MAIGKVYNKDAITYSSDGTKGEIKQNNRLNDPEAAHLPKGQHKGRYVRHIIQSKLQLDQDKHQPYFKNLEERLSEVIKRLGAGETVSPLNKNDWTNAVELFEKQVKSDIEKHGDNIVIQQEKELKKKEWDNIDIDKALQVKQPNKISRFGEPVSESEDSSVSQIGTSSLHSPKVQESPSEESVVSSVSTNGSKYENNLAEFEEDDEIKPPPNLVSLDALEDITSSMGVASSKMFSDTVDESKQESADEVTDQNVQKSLENFKIQLKLKRQD